MYDFLIYMSDLLSYSRVVGLIVGFLDLYVGCLDLSSDVWTYMCDFGT